MFSIYSFVLLWMPCKWNHALCSLLCLSPFTQSNAFEIHPVVSWISNSFLFHSEFVSQEVPKIRRWKVGIPSLLTTVTSETDQACSPLLLPICRSLMRSCRKSPISTQKQNDTSHLCRLSLREVIQLVKKKTSNKSRILMKSSLENVSLPFQP